MTDVSKIIEVYLDDRDQLDDSDMAALMLAIREEPGMARQLKEQLLLNELLGQRYGIDRQNFVAQVEQRVRDYQRDEEHVDQQVRHLRSIAENELQQWQKRDRSLRRTRQWLVCASLIIIMAGAWIWYQLSPGRWPLAVVQLVEGNVTRPTGSQDEEDVQQGDRVVDGDTYRTSPDQFIDFRYSDGTTLHAGVDSSIRFERDDMTGAKRVLVHYGSVAARISPQESGQAMLFHTPIAEVEVLGTELLMTVSPTVTSLHVVEGRVKLTRTTDDSTLWIEKDHCGVVSTSQIALRESLWPTNREKLVFLFQGGDYPNFARLPATSTHRYCAVKPLGLAAFNEYDAMLLEDGAFQATGFDDLLLNACRESDQLTVEAIVYPSPNEHPTPVPLITFSSSGESRNFEISQQGDRLLARIRTTDHQDDQMQPVLEVYQFEEDGPHHIALTYKSGQVGFYVDGQRKYHHELLKGELDNWTEQQLLFGGEAGGEYHWSGMLEGIAIFSRSLPPEEILADARAYHQMMNDRPQP